ncbi:MAG: type II toxin-antitoxin system PemK/MazF family toxin [bacterium]
MMPRQGEILLLPVPFTDLQAVKRRPVLVLSNDRYNTSKNDILVAAITSNVTDDDIGILIQPSDLQEGELRRTSLIRFDKLYCLNQKNIVKRFGRLKKEKHHDVIGKIRSFIELD